MATGETAAPLGYRLKLAQHAVHRAMETALRPTGLTLSQLAVLTQLGERSGQTNAELARGAFVTAQSMQGILSNLKKSGLIVRSPDAAHGRRQPAELTADGARRLAEAQAATHDVERRLSETVAPLDPDAVASLFDRIQDAFSK